jgi:hypothetical protein
MIRSEIIAADPSSISPPSADPDPLSSSMPSSPAPRKEASIKGVNPSETKEKGYLVYNTEYGTNEKIAKKYLSMKH